MGYEYILYEERDKVGILTLNRPEKRNALGREAEKEIIACLEDAALRHEAKVIIIKAAGKIFCSGHDRAEVLDKPLNDVRRLFQTSMEMMLAMHGVPQPIIAQVHGIAMAGGCHLAAACDLVVAAETEAKFGMTGLKIGYNCSTPTVAVSRCVGQKKCLEMLFTGRLYSAEQSREMGLVNMVAPDDQLEQKTWELAQEIAQGSKLVLGISKQVYYAQIEMTEWQAYQYAKEMMGAQAIMPDAVEGFTASIEGRQPVWKEE